MSVTYKGKNYYVDTFKCAIEAAHKYDAAKRAVYSPESAKNFNFPNQELWAAVAEPLRNGNGSVQLNDAGRVLKFNFTFTKQ